MFLRFLILILAFGAVVGALGLTKFLQIRAAIAKGMAFRLPPVAVTTVQAAEEEWEETIQAVGTVTATQGVRVSNEFAGMVTAIHFESGTRVEAGQPLLELDRSILEAQLASAEAGVALAEVNLARVRDLRRSNTVPQSELDSAVAAERQARANAEAIRADLAKRTIRAPFAGRLGIRQVNLGEYLPAGRAIADLQATDTVYVNFSVPQRRTADVQTGLQIRVRIEGGPADRVFRGEVTAVSPGVETATRTLTLQATLPNPDGALRPGMFVNVDIVLPDRSRYLTLPSSAISYTPYGRFVYVVGPMRGEDGAEFLGVRQEVVVLGPARGDQVAVRRGIRAGDEVVSSGTFRLRPNAAVTVNNTVTPTNDPSPRPPNT